MGTWLLGDTALGDERQAAGGVVMGERRGRGGLGRIFLPVFKKKDDVMPEVGELVGRG